MGKKKKTPLRSVTEFAS